MKQVSEFGGSLGREDEQWLDGEGDEEELDDVNESEKTWRDPSAHKVRCATNGWMRGRAAQKAIREVRSITAG